MPFIILFAFIIILYYLFHQNKKPKKKSTQNKIDQLVKLCYGDKEQAQRLVEGEREENPTISFDMAVDNAIHFIQRDR